MLTITAFMFNGKACPIRNVNRLPSNANAEVFSALDAVRQAAQLLDEALTQLRERRGQA